MGASQFGTNSSIIKVSTDAITLGGIWTPKLDAVAIAVANFRAPEIRRIGIRLNVNITTGAFGAAVPMYRLLDLFTSIVVKDKTGVRMNLTSGLVLRNILHTEYGDTYRDGPAQAASSGPTAFNKTLWLPFVPRRTRRPADFYIPATDLFTGFIQCKFNTATFGGALAITALTGNIETIIDVVEGGEFEAKSRLVWNSVAANSNNFTYSLNGTLLAAYYWNGRTNQIAGTAFGTAWAAQVITSNTLQISQVDSDVMQDLYEAQNPVRFTDLTTGDQEDPVRNGNYLPIHARDLFAPVSDQPVLKTLHYQTTGTVTSSTDEIHMGYVEPRSPVHTAQQLRVDPSRIMQILATGYVPHANGRRTPVKSFPNYAGDLDSPVWRLPVRLPGNVQAATAV